MNIKSITENRKELVQQISEQTGIKAIYKGVPSCEYEIGQYTVLKDGNIEVDDNNADMELLGALESEGYIELPKDAIQISLPLEGHTGRSLMNLINSIYTRSKILNKSTGASFNIGESVIAQLDECKPETKEDFLWVWQTAKANAEGLIFEDDRITFEFPLEADQEKNQAYMELAALMNKQALEQKRVKVEKKEEIINEKYYFRVWLVRIGMKGEKYKKARKILMENLDGNAAFLTEEQAVAHRIKYSKKGEESCGTKEQ